jgi:hypothetical protein
MEVSAKLHAAAALPRPKAGLEAVEKKDVSYPRARPSSRSLYRLR